MVLGFCEADVISSPVHDARAVSAFGEAGVIGMTGLIGCFTTVSMIMNVARTPLSGFAR